MDVQTLKNLAPKISVDDFGDEFVFGAATSAMQLEGAYKLDSRSMSVWDSFSLNRPDKIMEGGNTCVAIDHYNKYRDDVKMMKKMGLKAYRFSISWSRILPGGHKSAGINTEGVKFYSDLIDCLKEHDIEPYVTIFHFDVPQCLEDEYGGFLDKKIVDDFADYADICFFEFGDRVKHWITINESWTFTHHGYVSGNFPPAHGSDVSEYFEPVEGEPTRPRLPSNMLKTQTGDWDPSRECYKVAHHLLLSHATAVYQYRKDYQSVQGGQIGVTNMTSWYYPYDPSKPEDVAATQRAIDFQWGWFVAPIVFGDYPQVMKDRVKDRLPKFSTDEKNLLVKSFDFIGLNYYTSNYVSYKPAPPGAPKTYYTDQEIFFNFSDVDGRIIGERAGSTWLYNVPAGLYDFLVDVKNKYQDPVIYITENGWDDKNDRKITLTEGCNDIKRIEYHQQHLAAVLKAKQDFNVKVQAYFLWSLFDNFELAEGYTVRFGLVYVDYVNNFVRYPKRSALWYMNFLNRKNVQKSLRNKRYVDENDEVLDAGNKKKRR